MTKEEAVQELFELHWLAEKETEEAIQFLADHSSLDYGSVKYYCDVYRYRFEFQDKEWEAAIQFLADHSYFESYAHNTVWYYCDMYRQGFDTKENYRKQYFEAAGREILDAYKESNMLALLKKYSFSEN